jgi:hypothetical protein
MRSPEDLIRPDRTAFAADPFGYSALAWYKWAMVQTIAGFPVDPTRPPTSAELKSPVLWLAQAHALSEAASAVFEKSPKWDSMPSTARGICDCQYCAVGLMLVGYSLEICLKAMLIMKHGVEAYSANEKKYLHHRLEKLAEFMPELTERELAMLRVLTQFTTWAGRYPDPGSGREDNAQEIFALSERHQVAAKDLFALAVRIMKHAQTLTAAGSAADA